MKLEIFCVRDQATAQYGNPMFLVSRGQAIRSFGDEVNRRAQDNQLHVHPEDFSMWYLGTFDTDAGVFNTSAPVQVVSAKELVISA